MQAAPQASPGSPRALHHPPRAVSAAALESGRGWPVPEGPSLSLPQGAGLRGGGRRARGRLPRVGRVLGDGSAHPSGPGTRGASVSCVRRLRQAARGSDVINSVLLMLPLDSEMESSRASIGL